MLRRVDWSILIDVSEERKNTAVDHTRSSTLLKGKSLAELEIKPRDFHTAYCTSISRQMTMPVHNDVLFHRKCINIEKLLDLYIPPHYGYCTGCRHIF